MCFTFEFSIGWSELEVARPTEGVVSAGSMLAHGGSVLTDPSPVAKESLCPGSEVRRVSLVVPTEHITREELCVQPDVHSGVRDSERADETRRCKKVRSF